MPTENGSPLFAGFRSERDAASVAALREAGAVILGKTVTTEFAASEPRGTRNPGTKAARRADRAAVRPLRSRSERSASALARKCSARSCGRRVSAAATVSSRRSGRSTAAVAMTGSPRASTARSPQACPKRGSSLSRLPSAPAAIPVFRAFTVRAAPPPARKPRRLAVLETDGWEKATPGSKAAFAAARAKLKSAGVVLASRRDSEQIAAAESAIQGARELSMDINAWESRWPINTYAARDAGRLSKSMLDRLAQAEAMTLDDYRSRLADRNRRRAVYRRSRRNSTAASRWRRPARRRSASARPADPIFVVPAIDARGSDALTLPVLADGGSAARPATDGLCRPRRGAVFGRRRCASHIEVTSRRANVGAKSFARQSPLLAGLLSALQSRSREASNTGAATAPTSALAAVV